MAREFGSAPPFDVGPDALIVGYSLWAEMTCFAVLGWQFPEHVFCQHTAYLAASNVLLPWVPDEEKRHAKGSASAWSTLAARTASPVGKTSIKKRSRKILAMVTGRSTAARPCSEYCAEDVPQGGRAFPPAGTARPRSGSSRPTFRGCCIGPSIRQRPSRKCKAKGMPIDTRLWNAVQENKGRRDRGAVAEIRSEFRHRRPIFSPDGHWEDFRFEQYLRRAGVPAWPRLPSGKIRIDSDAFKLMSYVPGMEGLHALRDSIGVIAKARLPIGPEAAIGRRCFRSGPQQAATHTPRACLMRMPACARS